MFQLPQLDNLIQEPRFQETAHGFLPDLEIEFAARPRGEVGDRNQTIKSSNFNFVVPKKGWKVLESPYQTIQSNVKSNNNLKKPLGKKYGSERHW